MAEDFYKSLNNLPAGTFLSVIVFLILSIVGLYGWSKKQLKKHDGEVEEKTVEEHDEVDFKNQMFKMVDLVSNMDKEQRENSKTIYKKLEDLSSQLEQEKNESRHGDKLLSDKIDTYSKKMDETNEKMDKLGKSVDLVISSDKEQIKSFITLQYYESIHNKYIEPYILETLEARYATYLQENGDTYVETLMKELRELPKTKPVTRRRTTKKSTDKSD